MAARFAIALAIFIPTVCDCPIAQFRLPHPDAQTAQKIDTPAPHRRQSSPVGVTVAEGYDTDIPFLDVAFGTAEIDHLVATGRVGFAGPDGELVNLTLVANATVNGAQRIRVRHQGLVGTITRRGARFEATIPSTTTAYRLSGDAHQTRAISHRLISYRTLPHRDYRHVTL